MSEVDKIKNKIEVDAEALWAWFEKEIGLDHPATKSLNVIVPKPVVTEPIPELSTDGEKLATPPSEITDPKPIVGADTPTGIAAETN